MITTIQRFGVVACIALAPCVLLSPATHSASDPQKPRYQLPESGRPGAIYYLRYFQLDDPKQAATLLLQEAALAGVNVDTRRQGPVPDEIHVCSGTFTPNKEDTSFVENAALLSSEGHADSQTVCLVKLGRHLSYREFASVMSLGVHIYKHIQGNALIAGVPAGVAASLQRLDFVVWIGPYLTNYKYTEKIRRAGGYFYVYSLVGDKEFCRRDLARVGGRIRRYSEPGDGSAVLDQFYAVELDPDRVPDVASFWWVEKLWPSGVSKVESNVAPRQTQLAYSSTLHPADSRRLIGWRKGSFYDGEPSPETDRILVYDNGCDWNHKDLTSQIAHALSDPAADSTHGTWVSGIIAGRLNAGVDGGAVSGVAPGSQLVFKSYRVSG